MNNLKLLLTGFSGFIATGLTSLTLADLDTIVTTLVQIIIGIVTVYKLITKNKNSNEQN